MSSRPLLTISLCLTGIAIAADAPLPDPLEAGWKGEAVCEKLHEDERQRVLRCTFPPGVGHERHYHAPHFGYVITGGRMRIESADGVREVDLADDLTWTSDGVDWHEVLNIGDTTSVYLIVEPR
ncbi:MAG: hypothetical protein QNJ00_01600 [Woeseiaceae bacterium]|nr:hypothetical protein [Woeseiaceae bacterium]